MSLTEVLVEQAVLGDNALNAQKNRQQFAQAGLYVLNMMSGPGAGKTTLLERTIQTMKSRVRLGIIAGDLETRRDADRLEQHGVPVVQVNTGGACHMEAQQIAQAVSSLDYSALDLLIIENVGNMVCPAEFDLGETDRVMIFACSEGHDKPGKYPLMFRESQAILINKVDLLPYTDFDIDAAVKDIRALNANLDILKVSARTGEGLEKWFQWLEQRMRRLEKFKG